MNDDIKTLEENIKVIKEENVVLNLDNRDSRASIKSTDDDKTITKLQVIID